MRACSCSSLPLPSVTARLLLQPQAELLHTIAAANGERQTRLRGYSTYGRHEGSGGVDPAAIDQEARRVRQRRE